MGKKHLNLFPLVPRRNIGFGLGDITRHIANAFIDGAGYLARRSVRAASWFQGIETVLIDASKFCRGLAQAALPRDLYPIHTSTHHWRGRAIVNQTQHIHRERASSAVLRSGASFTLQKLAIFRRKAVADGSMLIQVILSKQWPKPGVGVLEG